MKHNYTYMRYMRFRIRTERLPSGGHIVTYAPIGKPSRRYVMELGDSPKERRYNARRVIEAGACDGPRRLRWYGGEA